MAINVLTMPALSVPNTVEAGSGDTVMRWWVYRNNTLAFCVQAHDPYYEDAGVNIASSNVPSYVPLTPGAAVNKYLPTTIVSGAGTTSIVVANAASNSIAGVPALHDNSQNYLNILGLSRFGNPVYLPSALPFNAATVLGPTMASNTHTRFSTLIINQPFVLRAGAYVLEGLQNHAGFENMAIFGGIAFPLFLYPNVGGPQGWIFKNVSFQALQLQQTAVVWDCEQSCFGLMMHNVSMGSRTNSDNLNTPAAYFKGITESSIGFPGERNLCATSQVALGPPCMRFTTVSTATQTSQVAIAGNIAINGYEITGSGACYQFDSLPFAFSGGNPNAVSGLVQIYINTGLREIGKGPFVRLAAQDAVMWIKNIDDDAANASPGNAFVDAAHPNVRSLTLDIEDILSSVGGQVIVAGVTTPTGVNVRARQVPFIIGSTATSLMSIGSVATTGTIQLFGTSNVGYALAKPLAPNAVAVAGATFPAGTYTVSITWVDGIGNQSFSSPATSVTTAGSNLNINVTPTGTPPAGAFGYVTYVNGLARDILTGSCTSMTTTPPTATASPTGQNCNGFGPSGTPFGSGASSSLSSLGLSGGIFNITPTAFAALPVAANGTLRYCSDCTIANPCAGSGTGAIAKRLNSVWVCN
jgi:hypothetical protein